MITLSSGSGARAPVPGQAGTRNVSLRQTAPLRLGIQRFDSGLRLNPHFAGTRWGVRARPSGQLCFEALHEVEHVAPRTAERLIALLKKHGRDVDTELGALVHDDELSHELEEEAQELAACLGRAVQRRSMQQKGRLLFFATPATMALAILAINLGLRVS